VVQKAVVDFSNTLKLILLYQPVFDVLKTSEVSGFAAEMACKRKHSKYSSLFRQITYLKI
jgi:hypothetical protein